jgi:hypothetical protein
MPRTPMLSSRARHCYNFATTADSLAVDSDRYLASRRCSLDEESPDLQQINLKALIGHDLSSPRESRRRLPVIEKCNIAFIAVLRTNAIGMGSRS